MKNERLLAQLKDKPIVEGYLAGGASLIITILWVLYSSFHPFVIFSLFLIALFCFTLSAIWQIKRRNTIKESLRSPIKLYAIVGLINIALVATFFMTLYTST